MTTKKLMPLREFLQKSGVPYHTYRRLRLKGVTPPETRLSHKIVLLDPKDLHNWQAKAAQKLLKLRRQSPE